MNEYTALGLMSGSSLDGVDLTFCHFFEEGQSWHYHIEVAETIAYNEVWKQFLMESLHVSAEELPARDVKFGNYLGKLINDFLKRHNLKPDLIALHGHTLFHQPKQGFSFQLGSGQAIAIKTGIETISDFRNKDILLGGQGAPLVPIGDTQLFADYDFCLNIGGIANISFDVNGIRKALDVCPANQLLNHLSELMGEPYDKGGKMS
ncbi:Anhydro-N-acetylmuramic acid kinase, partial [hydrothermal vent metagenome]